MATLVHIANKQVGINVWGDEFLVLLSKLGHSFFFAVVLATPFSPSLTSLPVEYCRIMACTSLRFAAIAHPDPVGSWLELLNPIKIEEVGL